MDWSAVAYKLLETLLPIVAAVMIAALTYAITFLKHKTETIKNDDFRSQVREALEYLHTTVSAVVDAISQETVDDIKAIRADGKLTDAEKTAFKTTAFDRIMTALNKESKDLLEYAVGNLTEYVQTLIEAYLKDRAVPKEPLSLSSPVSG